jgi:hypothetical protein
VYNSLDVATKTVRGEGVGLLTSNGTIPPVIFNKVPKLPVFEKMKAHGFIETAYSRVQAPAEEQAHCSPSAALALQSVANRCLEDVFIV